MEEEQNLSCTIMMMMMMMMISDHKRKFNFHNFLTKYTFSLSLGTWGSSNLNSWYPITVKYVCSEIIEVKYEFMLSHLKESDS